MFILICHSKRNCKQEEEQDMEGKQERPQHISFEPRKLKMNETKKQHMPVTSHSVNTTPRCYADIAHLATPRGPSDSKPNCLCSPTTHVGSFRCRYHRTSPLANHANSFNDLSNLDHQN